MALHMAAQTLPVSLKSLSLDGDGRLSRRRAVGPLLFAFAHAGRAYSCRFTERGPRAVIALETTLGTVTDLPTARRRAVRQVIRAARQQGIGLILRRDGRVDLAERLRPTPPVQAHDLLGALSAAVVRATPWMTLIEEQMAGA